MKCVSRQRDAVVFVGEYSLTFTSDIIRLKPIKVVRPTPKTRAPIGLIKL